MSKRQKSMIKKKSGKSVGQQKSGHIQDVPIKKYFRIFIYCGVVLFSLMFSSG